MAWVRIDDGAMQHPKILALSDSAFRLWVRGLCYCQANLTDGLLPAPIVRDMKPKRVDLEALTRSLAGTYAPLWEVVDGFGYKVHDYLFWNDSRDKVRQRQGKAKARLDRWRDKHSHNGVTNAVSSAVVNGASNGVLTKPNQTKERTEERTHTFRARATPLMGNEHRAHAECGRVCVPAFLHRQFKDSLGGDEQNADARVRAWYGRVLDALSDDEPVPSDAPKFWRPLFDAEFVKAAPTQERDYEADTRAQAEAALALLHKKRLA